MTTERLKPFFDFSIIDKNRINGLCKLCHQNYKDRAGISSNFWKHLKRKHSSVHEQFFKSSSENPVNEVVSEDENNPTTTTLSSAKLKQSRINTAIAKCLIIKCNLPLSLVENSAFREFMKECNVKWNPISSKKLKQDPIATFKETANKLIREALDSVEHVTLTVDGWSDRRCRSFLGVTCHFINRRMEPQAYLIDLVRLKSPHTGENIHRTTECILDRFNLKEKVYRVVTDNASNMVKAYKFGLSGDDDVAIDDDVGSSIEMAPNNDTDTLDGKRLFSLESKIARRKQNHCCSLENALFS